MYAMLKFLGTYGIVLLLAVQAILAGDSIWEHRAHLNLAFLAVKALLIVLACLLAVLVMIDVRRKQQNTPRA
jgi:membrane protein DedA with SNARE-associated domain